MLSWASRHEKASRKAGRLRRAGGTSYSQEQSRSAFFGGFNRRFDFDGHGHETEGAAQQTEGAALV